MSMFTRIEFLERRRLLAAAVYTVPTIAFAGRTIHAVPGEWVVSLRAREAFSASSDEPVVREFLQSDVRDNGMLAGKLATAGLALKSASYLGTNDHVLLKFDPSLNADAVAASLYRTPGITGVSPNLIGEFASTIPNDPYANGAPNYKQRWHDIIHTIDRYDDAVDPYAYHGAWAYTTVRPV